MPYIVKKATPCACGTGCGKVIKPGIYEFLNVTEKDELIAGPECVEARAKARAAKQSAPPAPPAPPDTPVPQD